MTASFPANSDALSSELSRIRLRLLSYSTSDMLARALTKAFTGTCFSAQITCADFGNVIPELLDPKNSTLDGLIIQLDVSGFYHRDWRASPEDSQRLLEEKTDEFLAAVTRFSKQGGCPILVNTLPSPRTPTVGFLDTFHTDGAGYSVSYFNGALSEMARQNNQIMVIDTDVVMAHIAPLKRSDPKLWFYGRIPYAMDATRALAQGFFIAYALQKAKPVKVLALDLDNTLWRGIFGEDGLAGIECGDDFPGNAFQAFQQECLRLKGQGMLLTILSKNNHDVLRVFDEHPGMILKRDDFVGLRINWEPKPHNIRELAQDLELGLDSFLFLDDSPHEREAMVRLVPEVHVPDLPDDPAVRPDFLRNYAPTWPVRLTLEDRSRSKLYAVQSKGRDLKNQATSFEDYLSQLDQELHVEVMTPATLPRVAQMHERTNQFNLTTRRFAESDLEAMMSDENGYCVVLGRVSDRFGDHGIVICACTRMNGDCAEILTFLMSCRVIGRQIERAFLSELLRHLSELGINQVEATFIPTQKNEQTRDFYKSMGFSPKSSNETSKGEQTKWFLQNDNEAKWGSDFVKTSFVS